MRLLVLVLGLAVTLLAGCDTAAPFDRLVPQEETRLAKTVVAQVSARDFAAVEAALDPALRTAELGAQLENLARTVPPGPVTSVQVVGASTVMGPSGTTYTITLECQHPSAWMLAVVVLRRQASGLLLQGLHFVPRSQSLASENQFTLAGKGPLHYGVLVAALLIPAYVLYALVICLRSRFAGRKWPWVLFVACGLVQFHFNWSTGEWGVQWIAVLLLGAGFTKSGPVAPWILTLSLPLGAFFFLSRRRREPGWPGVVHAAPLVEQAPATEGVEGTAAPTPAPTQVAAATLPAQVAGAGSEREGSP